MHGGLFGRHGVYRRRGSDEEWELERRSAYRKKGGYRFPILLRLQHQISFLAYPLKVNLSGASIGDWNVELGLYSINERDKEVILSIPLASRWPKDKLVWQFSISGHFTVKSCYHMG